MINIYYKSDNRVNVSNKGSINSFLFKEVEGSKDYVSNSRRFQDKPN
ncbi:hypothetical protein [Clostridium sp.]|nr:hypothetical protein [Clostridium sp.]